jgi:hypothetical protein
MQNLSYLLSKELNVIFNKQQEVNKNMDYSEILCSKKIIVKMKQNAIAKFGILYDIIDKELPRKMNEIKVLAVMVKFEYQKMEWK